MPAPGSAPWLQQPGQPGYGYPGMAGQYSGTNGLAVASFVLGLLGFLGFPLILSAVFGIVALVQIRDRQQRGKGLAIAGLAVSAAWVLLFALLITIGAVAGQHTSG
jgi:hypothetical protein